MKKPASAQNEKIDRLLEWILHNKNVFQVQGSPTKPESGGSKPTEEAAVKLDTLSTDFVCFRGLLTALMCTPYERRDGWEFNAVKFKNTIYLCAVETEQKRAQRQNETQRQRDMCSWGYKFEQYVLSDQTRVNDSDYDLFNVSKSTQYALVNP